MKNEVKAKNLETTDFDRIFRQNYEERLIYFRVGQTIEIDDLSFVIESIDAWYDKNNDFFRFCIWGSKYPNTSLIMMNRIIKYAGKYWKIHEAFSGLSFQLKGDKSIYNEYFPEKSRLAVSKNNECEWVSCLFNTQIIEDNVITPNQWNKV